MQLNKAVSQSTALGLCIVQKNVLQKSSSCLSVKYKFGQVRRGVLKTCPVFLRQACTGYQAAHLAFSGREELSPVAQACYLLSKCAKLCLIV